MNKKILITYNVVADTFPLALLPSPLRVCFKPLPPHAPPQHPSTHTFSNKLPSCNK